MTNVEVTKEALVNALCNSYFSLCHDEWDPDKWDEEVLKERKELEQFTLQQLIEHEVRLEKDPHYGPTTIEEFIDLHSD